MEYDSSWYRPAEFILLLISMILQIVSISTPWWKIHTYAERPLFGLGSNATLQDLVDNNTTGQTTAESLPEEQFYIGVFYSTKCTASTCETKTLHERHLDRISGSVTGQDPTYDREIMEQVTVIVALIITIVCVPLQVRMLRSRYSQFLFTTVNNGLWLSFAGGLMIRQLMSYYVDENATLERSRIEQYFEVSLPYCVLLYTVAFVLTTLIVLLYAIEVCRIRQNRNIEDQLIRMDDVAMKPAGIDNLVNHKNSWSSLT